MKCFSSYKQNRDCFSAKPGSSYFSYRTLERQIYEIGCMLYPFSNLVLSSSEVRNKNLFLLRRWKMIILVEMGLTFIPSLFHFVLIMLLLFVGCGIIRLFVIGSSLCEGISFLISEVEEEDRRKPPPSPGWFSSGCDAPIYIIHAHRETSFRARSG